MLKRQVTVLDAPSNLGLRPPEDGAVPGCYKLPWALRDRHLLSMLDATDAGSLVPPRYRAAWSPGDGDRNAHAIATFSTVLADRVGVLFNQETFALVLGGDCSILIGNMLALKRRGRYGLVFLDAHSDFRHPGNAAAIGAAAGEDLAIVTGRGDPRLVNLDGLGPYVRDEDVVLVGTRPSDEYLDELAGLGINVITSSEWARVGAQHAAICALATATHETDGFWVHLDLDVVDEQEMPAVDCPEPNGPSFAELTRLLQHVFASPHCVGLELTIYDPDLDPTGHYPERINRCLQDALGST